MFYLRSCRLNGAPVLLVNLVHLYKVGHVGQEHVDLDYLVKARTCCFENSTKVLNTLALEATVNVSRFRRMSSSPLTEIIIEEAHTVRSWTVPALTFPSSVFGVWPEQNTKPLATIAWLYTGRGFGALSVKTASLDIFL
jgi:hypothetical protein